METADRKMLSQFMVWVKIAEEYLALKNREYVDKPKTLKYLDEVIEQHKAESHSKGYLLQAVTAWASALAHRDSEEEADAKIT